MSKKYPDIDFAIDISNSYDPRFERGLELFECFPNVDFVIATKQEIWDIEGKITFKYRGKGSRLIRLIVDTINNFTVKRKNCNLITEENYYVPEKNSGKYYSGYWQTINKYLDIKDDLISELEFKEISDADNRKLVEMINKSSTSVSIHVRRGDYVGSDFDVLTTEYYKRVVDNINSSNKDAKYYIFSDDSKWVEKEFEWLTPKYIVDINRGLTSYRDMQLMSLCKINVVANSSFSMMAAYLNNHTDKKVYYPSKKFKMEMYEKILSYRWIMVDV